MYVIGLWAGVTDSSACLFYNGTVLHAALESWFSKSTDNVPVNAFLYCLNEGDIAITEIDCIAVSLELQGNEKQMNMSNLIRNLFGYHGEIVFQGNRKVHIAGEEYLLQCGGTKCIVAAAACYRERMGDCGFMMHQPIKLELGPGYSYAEGKDLLEITDFTYLDYCDREKELKEYLTDALSEGNTIAMFRGKTQLCSTYGGRNSLITASGEEDKLKKILGMSNKSEQAIYYLSSDGKDLCGGGGGFVPLYLNYEKDPFFFELISIYHAKTLRPGILSTQLCRNSKVIISSVEALAFFVMSKTDILVLGDYVVPKKINKKPSLSWMRIQLLKCQDELWFD